MALLKTVVHKFYEIKFGTRTMDLDICNYHNVHRCSQGGMNVVMEIERRYLIKDKAKIDELVKNYEASKKRIVQDYIYSDLFTAIRKRMIVKGNEEIFFYTVKTGRNGFGVHEFEEQISKEKYDLLAKDPNRITIEKDRFLIPYEDNLVIELDVFHGAYEGLVFAEIEFTCNQQASSVHIPEWFGPELTGVVSNNKMSKSIIDIEELLKANL